MLIWLDKIGHYCDVFINITVKSHATLNKLIRAWRDMEIIK